MSLQKTPCIPLNYILVVCRLFPCFTINPLWENTKRAFCWFFAESPCTLRNCLQFLHAFAWNTYIPWNYIPVPYLSFFLGIFCNKFPQSQEIMHRSLCCSFVKNPCTLANCIQVLDFVQLYAENPLTFHTQVPHHFFNKFCNKPHCFRKWHLHLFECVNKK